MIVSEWKLVFIMVGWYGVCWFVVNLWLFITWICLLLQGWTDLLIQTCHLLAVHASYREFGGRLVAYALGGEMRVTNVFKCNLLVCRLSHGRLRIFRDGFW